MAFCIVECIKQNSRSCIKINSANCKLYNILHKYKLYPILLECYFTYKSCNAFRAHIWWQSCITNKAKYYIISTCWIYIYIVNTHSTGEINRFFKKGQSYGNQSKRISKLVNSFQEYGHGWGYCLQIGKTYLQKLKWDVIASKSISLYNREVINLN